MQVNLYRQRISEPADYPKGEWIREKRLYWANRLRCEMKHIEFGAVPVQGSTDRHFIIYVEDANVPEDGKKALAEIGSNQFKMTPKAELGSNG